MPNHAPHGRAWLALVVGLVVAPGCVTREPSVDAGLDAPEDAPRTFLDVPPPDVWRGDALSDVPWDGDLPDAYDPRLCVTFEPGTFASPCRADGSCDPGLVCGAGSAVRVTELDGTISDVPLFPGICTRRCDPDARRPCGACGTCMTSIGVGSGRVSILDEDGRGVCAQPCFAPVRGLRPTCLGGQACDRVEEACIPACTNDHACLLAPTPFEATPFARLPSDVPLPVACGEASRECTRVAPSAPWRGGVGDPCKTELDCQLEHACYRGSAGGPGTCALYTDCESRGCGPDAVCVALDPAVWVCATP